MKKWIKLITITSVILCISIVTALAVQAEYTQVQPFYLSFTGNVKEIEKTGEVITKIFLENEEGSQAYFIFNENTYFADDMQIEEGDRITGYYESDKPMILIYPPQYTICIVTPVYEDGFVKADKFDSDLTSRDGQLRINISENTEILWENNTEINWIKKPTLEEVEKVLSNRKMLVYYDVTTKSIPAQTTPNRIVVLSQQAEDKPVIFVNDVELETPNVYTSETGTVMIPVRAISEALGYEVKWNGNERKVTVGNDISFVVGESNYLSNETYISLEDATSLKDGSTYVPLNFFKKVMNIDNLSVVGSKIIINALP